MKFQINLEIPLTMHTRTCIFCYAQVLSRDKKELEVKFENHLVDWHNIADENERKLAISRTMEKDLLNKSESHEEEMSLVRELSDNIENVMKKAPSAVEQQFTIENEDYTVRSMVIGEARHFLQEVEATHNPNTSTIDMEKSVHDDIDVIGDRVNNEVSVKDGEDFSNSDSAVFPVMECELDADSSQKVNTIGIGDTIELVAQVTKKVANVGKDAVIDGSSVTLSDDSGVGSEVTRDCSVKVTKLKENVIKQLISVRAEGDISVPWYEWGHHLCVVCNSAVFLGSVERHLDLNHSLSLVDYKQQHKIPQEALSIPPYECLVCGVTVVHTLKKILSHLQLHNIDLGSYYFQYVSVKRVEGDQETEMDEVQEDAVSKEGPEKSIQEREDDCEQVSASLIKAQPLIISKKTKPLHSSPSTREVDAPLAECSQPKTSRTPSTSGPRRSLPALASLDSSMSVRAATAKKRPRTNTAPVKKLPWYEGAWHRCLECDEITMRGLFLTSHVRKHKMNKKLYMEKYKADKLDDVPDWNCGICSKKISWATKPIGTHLARIHDMSKDHYASVYINNMQEGIKELGEAVLCDNEEIVLEGEAQTQRLDTTQNMIDISGIEI